MIFTQHALLKLEQRNISKLFVLKTLESPDYEFDSFQERKIVYRKFGKLYLKVMYKKEAMNIIIITQYWEEKAKLIK